jgi:hypothetical protein
VAIQVCKSPVTIASIATDNSSSEAQQASTVPRCQAGQKVDSKEVPNCRYYKFTGNIYDANDTVAAFSKWTCTTRLYDESITDNEADSSKNRRCSISTGKEGEGVKTPAVVPAVATPMPTEPVKIDDTTAAADCR